MSSYPTTVVAQMDWPMDWARLFGREAPLLLEIGFGTATFLMDLAKRRPEANIVGIEISRPSLAKAEQKIRRAGLSNVRLVQGGAVQLLWNCYRPDTLKEIYINFSDPWPKHIQRRLIDDRFLALAASRLTPGGLIDIATDHADYAAQITQCLGRSAYLQSRLDTPFRTSDPGRHQTKYELKGLAEGRTCHYYKYYRSADPTPDLFPIPKELEMPHVVVKTPLTLAEIKTAFNPFHQSMGETHVRFIQLFENVHDNSLLVETHIGEPPLAQQIGLTIRYRTEGELIFRLGDIGFPRPTVGTHQAIHMLSAWVMTLAANAEQIHSNLRLA